MIRRSRRHALMIAGLAAAILLAPAAALASRPHTGGTGGAGLGGATTATTTTPATTTAPAGTTPAGTASGTTTLHLNTVMWTTGNGLTIGATGAMLSGGTMTFTGSAPATDAGDTVMIRYASPTSSGGWLPAAQTTVGSTGSFSTTWRADLSGRLAFIASLVPTAAVAAAAPLSTSFAIQIFKPAVATIYGPGLWGRQTACGERLRKTTLGVASRTLKCGTEVAVYHDHREIVVPVIDRGPFSNHATWDLTLATAKALAVSHTATVATIAPWPQSQQPSARS